MDIELISTDLIDDNPYQVRRHYNDVPGLANDILSWKPILPETLGLQQVPSGRWESGRIQLVFGHRRLRAFRHNAHTDGDYELMPVRIMDLSDAQMLDGVWTENSAREDFCDVERAELMQAKYEQLGTHAAVATAWGLDRSTVTNLLGMLDLPEEVKAANRDGRISGRMLDAIARLHRVNPTSHLIKKAILYPNKYSSTAIRLAAKKAKTQRHGGYGGYTFERIAVPNGLPPALRMSGHKADLQVYRSVTFACRACQETAPVTDVICDECPLTVFLRRLTMEGGKTA